MIPPKKPPQLLHAANYGFNFSGKSRKKVSGVRLIALISKNDSTTKKYLKGF
jgi:hypothetical protein